MPVDEETRRRALVDYHRRGASTQLVNSLVLTPIRLMRARLAPTLGRRE